MKIQELDDTAAYLVVSVAGLVVVIAMVLVKISADMNWLNQKKKYRRNMKLFRPSTKE